MVLRVTLSDCLIEEALQCVFVDLGCRIRKLIWQKIHEALHEVSLSHKQIFSDAIAVSLKFIFVDQYVE